MISEARKRLKTEMAKRKLNPRFVDDMSEEAVLAALRAIDEEDNDPDQGRRTGEYAGGRRVLQSYGPSDPLPLMLAL